MQYNQQNNSIFTKKSKSSIYGNILGRIRSNLRCLGSVIFRCLCPYDRQVKEAAQKHSSSFIKAFESIFLSLLLGLSRPSGLLSPFALGALCCADASRALLFYIGSAISCLFSGTGAIIEFITFFLLYFTRKNLTSGSFSEKPQIRIITAFTVSLFIGACSLFTNTISADEVFSFLTYVCLSVSCTYLFYPVLCGKENGFSESYRLLSLYAITLCTVPAICRINLFGIDFALIYTCFLTLCFSRARGPVYGCVAGFILGFACSNPLSSAPLGVAGLISGFLFTKSVFISLSCFSLSVFFIASYLFGFSALSEFLPYSCAASLFFLLFGDKAARLFKSKRSLSKARFSSRQATSGKDEFDRVSESLSGLSSILFKLSNHLKNPSSAETGDIFDNAFRDTCASCSLSSFCYAKKECNLRAVRSRVITLLSEGRFEENDLSKMLLDKCIKSSELYKYISEHYSELCFLTMKANRTGTVANLYNSMSHLIKATSKTDKENSLRDARLEKLIGTALKKIGVEFSYAEVLGTRNKEIFIHGIAADKIPCTSSELSSYLSKECNMKISEPAFDISDSADMIMKFTRGDILSLEYAQCCISKQEGTVSGDTVSFFDTDKGYFYSIIADGMGCGKVAAATSRLTCIFLEKLLCAGTAKNVCLEMLNNLLLSKSDETFSTVDLLEVDKLNASAYFIKAGAAPSFVLRNSRLYKIASETPPVGIIPSFSAESTRFSLEKGDVIIMVSDGVITSDSDARWLSELIRLDSSSDPALLAGELIERAKNIGGRTDDASACVIRVI